MMLMRTRLASKTTATATAGFPAAVCPFCLSLVEVRDGKLIGHIHTSPSEYGDRCRGSNTHL